MLRVLGRPTSINVRKVLWTLDEIGISYGHEAEWATPAAPSTSPALLALNPNGLIPVIVDGDAVLWESNVICRYLAARHGRKDLLPSDPLARAGVEQWMDWQATELAPAWLYAFLGLCRKVPGWSDPARITDSLTRWDARMGMLEARLAATGAYVAGDDFTVADICIGLGAHRCRSTPRTAPLGPATLNYMQRLQARSAAVRHLTPETP